MGTLTTMGLCQLSVNGCWGKSAWFGDLKAGNLGDNVQVSSKYAARVGLECRKWSLTIRSEVGTETEKKTTAFVQNGEDKLEICRVINGMWQTSGAWGKIDRDKAVDAMLRHADAGFATFDMADHYGPAEDLYGIFINRVRRERGEELASNVRGLTKWVPYPAKMTRPVVEASIDQSRKRMDVKALDMLQFHWYTVLRIFIDDAKSQL